LTDPVAYRARVLDVVVDALRRFADDPGFHAVFEGGSAATGRLDAYSDIDLCVVAEAPLNEALFAAIEAALGQIAPIGHVWAVADAPWPGFAQKFYLLEGAPRFFALDCSLMLPATGVQFLEVERHGAARVLFDPRHWVRPQPLDRAAHAARLQRRRAQNLAAWPVYRMLVDKELARGRPLDAFGFYQALLRMLVEAAGLLHRPDRFDYGWRYLHHDLPPSLQTQLEQLAYVGRLDDLAARLPQADSLHRTLHAALATSPATSSIAGTEAATGAAKHVALH
jgi:hypothetical protein